MTRRVVLMIVVAILGIVLLYLSRFWFADFWGRPGLLGNAQLPPGGALLGRWLRGTPLAPFELLIWACGVFVVLTWAEKLLSRFKGPED